MRKIFQCAKVGLEALSGSPGDTIWLFVADAARILPFSAEPSLVPRSNRGFWLMPKVISFLFYFFFLFFYFFVLRAAAFPCRVRCPKKKTRHVIEADRVPSISLCTYDGCPFHSIPFHSILEKRIQKKEGKRQGVKALLQTSDPDRSMQAMENKLEYLRAIAAENDTAHSNLKQNSWKKPSRRHKATRQLLTDEWKRLTNDSAEKNRLSYFNVEAPPSIYPAKKYCDITGLKARYKAPGNGLRFANSEVYSLVIKPMAPGIDQEYLKLRGANVVLK